MTHAETASLAIHSPFLRQPNESSSATGGDNVGKLTPLERRRLINRAVDTVLDMREQADFSTPAVSGEVLDEIEAIGRDIAVVPDKLVAAALLEVADMMRNLKILLDAKGEGVNERRIREGFVHCET